MLLHEFYALLLYAYSHKLLIYVGIQGFDDSYEQTDIGTFFSFVGFDIKFLFMTCSR